MKDIYEVIEDYIVEARAYGMNSDEIREQLYGVVDNAVDLYALGEKR